MIPLFFKKRAGGYTLIELIISVGLFALVMTLAAGAYLVMIGVNRQVQATATGINNLAFALETMTRSIRTGSNYNCGTQTGGDCPSGDSSFYFADSNGKEVSYELLDGTINRKVPGVDSPLTDSSINITNLTFYAYGTSRGDSVQSRVTMIVSGEIPVGNEKKQLFSVETSATMRGTDL